MINHKTISKTIPKAISKTFPKTIPRTHRDGYLRDNSFDYPEYYL